MKSYFTCAKLTTPVSLDRLFNIGNNIYATILDGDYEGLWHKLPDRFYNLLKEVLAYKPVEVASNYSFYYLIRTRNSLSKWGG